MGQPLDWDRDGRDWPFRAASRFVQAGGLRWHVQQTGQGPVALLLHGTGASTHSWRGLMPLLAQRFTVVAMDLPGHAFTQTPRAARDLSLDGMASAVEALVAALALPIHVMVGHSAGAAIAARIALDERVVPAQLVGINGAYFPLGGLQGLVFPPVARLMAATPYAARLFARRGWDRAAVEKLLSGTGSKVDSHGLELYGRLVSNTVHAAGALQMMAQWDLRALDRDLRRLHTPLSLIVGANDRAVPPADARRVQQRVQPGARCSIEVIPGAGHLVHEERPAAVLAAIDAALLRPAAQG